MVKHFKFRQDGPAKRRIHATPDRVEVAACRPWLAAELTVLDPQVVVLLGATAAQGVLGPAFRVTRQRGVLLPWPPADGPFAPAAEDTEIAEPEDGATHSAYVLATVHPSAVLRADDREGAYAGLVADLRTAARALG